MRQMSQILPIMRNPGTLDNLLMLIAMVVAHPNQSVTLVLSRRKFEDCNAQCANYNKILEKFNSLVEISILQI